MSKKNPAYSSFKICFKLYFQMLLSESKNNKCFCVLGALPEQNSSLENSSLLNWQDDLSYLLKGGIWLCHALG